MENAGDVAATVNTGLAQRSAGLKMVADHSGNLPIQKRRKSCRHSSRKPRLSAWQLRLVWCFAQCRYRSNVRQYQALFCLLTKRKLALVIRAVQLVSQGSIGVIGVPYGAARQASPASRPKDVHSAGSKSRSRASGVPGPKAVSVEPGAACTVVWEMTLLRRPSKRYAGLQVQELRVGRVALPDRVGR